MDIGNTVSEKVLRAVSRLCAADKAEEVDLEIVASWRRELNEDIVGSGIATMNCNHEKAES